MTTCIAIGDPHFRLDNASDVEKAIVQTVTLTKQLNPDFVVVLGDILHDHNLVKTQAYKLAITWFELLSEHTHLYVMIGNHDYIDQSQFLTDEHIFGTLRNYPNITLVDHVVCHSINDQIFTFVPYVPPGEFENALNTIPDAWQDSTCIFAHQEFYGCKMGAKPSTEGDVWLDSYPPVVSGHIHEAQRVGSNVFYPGSLMQHAQGDNSPKSIWYLQFDPYNDEYFTRIKYKLDDIKPRKSIDVKIDQLHDFDETLFDQYYLRLVVHCSTEEKKSFMRTNFYKTHKRNIKIIITDKETNKPAYKVRKGISHGKILSDIIEKKDKPTQEVFKELVREGIISM